jgi:hypothetical protein
MSDGQQHICLPLTGSKSCDMYGNNALDLTQFRRSQASTEADGVTTLRDFDDWVENSAKFATGGFFRALRSNCTNAFVSIHIHSQSRNKGATNVSMEEKEGPRAIDDVSEAHAIMAVKPP